MQIFYIYDESGTTENRDFRVIIMRILWSKFYSSIFIIWLIRSSCVVLSNLCDTVHLIMSCVLSIIVKISFSTFTQYVLYVLYIYICYFLLYKEINNFFVWKKWNVCCKTLYNIFFFIFLKYLPYKKILASNRQDISITLIILDYIYIFDFFIDAKKFCIWVS